MSNTTQSSKRGDIVMCDVYLGGISCKEWRRSLKNEISQDISIFDPTVEGYDDYDEFEKSDHAAKELFQIERCDVIVFYLNEQWDGASTLLELGDSVALDKQVVVCLDGDVKGQEKIKRYCEYRGVFVVNSLDELIVTIEEYIAQIDLCNLEGFD